MPTTFADLEARLRGVESRVAHNEEDITALISTAVDIRRRVTKIEITITRIAAHLGVGPASDSEVDAALDETG